MRRKTDRSALDLGAVVASAPSRRGEGGSAATDDDDSSLNIALTSGRVLLVDDEVPLLRALARILQRTGCHVQTAESAHEALGFFSPDTFDVVLSDITMPDMNGLELTRRVRKLDPLVSVILMTGNPSVETAVRALEYGAMRYLEKPLNMRQLRHVVSEGVVARRRNDDRRDSAELPKVDPNFQSGNPLFDSALSGLWMAYQPIVTDAGKQVYGFEALMRTTDANYPNPSALLNEAERTGGLPRIGHLTRSLVARDIHTAPSHVAIFVNLHPSDLSDERLLESLEPLEPYAQRVVLEITERASFQISGATKARLDEIRRRGFRVAVDDLGSGYAGLSLFASLKPDVVKIDMALVRDIHTSPTKARLVGALIEVCSDLGVQVIAEGIEAKAEHETLAEMGCEYYQGYYFAMPGHGFPIP